MMCESHRKGNVMWKDKRVWPFRESCKTSTEGVKPNKKPRKPKSPEIPNYGSVPVCKGMMCVCDGYRRIRIIDGCGYQLNVTVVTYAGSGWRDGIFDVGYFEVAMGQTGHRHRQRGEGRTDVSAGMWFVVPRILVIALVLTCKVNRCKCALQECRNSAS